MNDVESCENYSRCRLSKEIVFATTDSSKRIRRLYRRRTRRRDHTQAALARDLIERLYDEGVSTAGPPSANMLGEQAPLRVTTERYAHSDPGHGTLRCHPFTTPAHARLVLATLSDLATHLDHLVRGDHVDSSITHLTIPTAGECDRRQSR